jgi:hypothetical protein
MRRGPDQAGEGPGDHEGDLRSGLEAELGEETAPAVQRGLEELRQVHTGDPPDELARVERLAEAWVRFERLWRSGALDPGPAAAERATAARVAAILEPATELAAEMAAIETEEARESQARAQATYGAARSRILLLSAAAVLVCLLIAMALVRNLVPRLRSYSSFAGRVADGQLGERLTPRGGDEVADLGRALDLMVGRREGQRAYEEAQAEFADTMQLSETETEAHELLKRHLERSIDGSRVTVLNRNNSADRLEPATAVDPACPLHDNLQGAKPRTCLAVRFGRGHQGGLEREPLLRCQVCGQLPDATTCEPLLVGGQVIGSVLVDHPAGTDIGPRIRDSVMQAAPVLANLRNLAIAEIRAATDVLTGLPNNRSSLRESDFVGRYGGEEFLILLPDTGKQQARTVAEKVRAAVEAIVLSNLELRVTASLGVASLPDDCSDADSLVRAADRALYAAKGRGRNRVELFESQRGPAPDPEPSRP